MSATARWSFLLLIATFVAVTSFADADRNFTIDYSNDRFLKDGEPIQIVSGTIHYYRVHPTDWSDRLQKLRYAGFNAVDTYVEWSSHQPDIGIYDFSGMNDLVSFLQKAQEEDLLVILRPGPFIDAERDMGGLPFWLLRENPDMELRTSDSSFLHYVDVWFGDVLFPLLKPLLYSAGGPVIMVQVENEYGSYPACDYEYTAHLRDLTRSKLGDDIVLHTTDGDRTSDLQCGKIPNVYATVDFGSGTNVTAAFGTQRVFEPQGPLMNSEYYPGWLDHWGQPHSSVETEAVVATLDEMLAMGASVNMYVAHGGTNFGLTSGSNMGDTFQACPTSYDYGAPISEAGDLTDKYNAVRQTIGKYLTLPTMPAPTNSSKTAYGAVPVTATQSLLDVYQDYPFMTSDDPLTFEALNHSNGLVVYETVVAADSADPAMLSFKSVNDRGYVYLDGILAGLVAREQEIFEVPIHATAGQKLTVVVESQGRICYGADINDFKGLVGKITLGSQELKNWKNTPVLLEQLSQQSTDRLTPIEGGALTLYEGTLQVSGTPTDTFLRLDGWTKGIAWVNGFMLGRYWPVMGPQLTLYVPHGVLVEGSNSVQLLELEEAPCGASAGEGDCQVSFTADHVIDGPTPQ